MPGAETQPVKEEPTRILPIVEVSAGKSSSSNSGRLSNWNSPPSASRSSRNGAWDCTSKSVPSGPIPLRFDSDVVVASRQRNFDVFAGSAWFHTLGQNVPVRIEEKEIGVRQLFPERC